MCRALSGAAEPQILTPCLTQPGIEPPISRMPVWNRFSSRASTIMAPGSVPQSICLSVKSLFSQTAEQIDAKFGEKCWSIITIMSQETFVPIFKILMFKLSWFLAVFVNMGLDASKYFNRLLLPQITVLQLLTIFISMVLIEKLL